MKLIKVELLRNYMQDKQYLTTICFKKKKSNYNKIVDNIVLYVGVLSYLGGVETVWLIGSR